jgi:hypothetical protein
MQNSHWDTLRECWAELRHSETCVFGGEPLPQDLQPRHTQALEALVAGGELATSVAGKVKLAFEQMLAHKEGLMSMCYIAFPAEYFSRQDLMGQVAVLEEMAGKSNIDLTTVTQMREALERDIAWLAALQAGETPGNVSDLEVDTSSAEAARVLVELLLKDGGIA